MSKTDRPARILVAAFARMEDLETACSRLEKAGVAQDFMGVLTRQPKAGGHNGHLLSVTVAPRRLGEIRTILHACGATATGTPEELEPVYGPSPHPGLWEDHDLKLPSGREYPDTEWEPALSGYRVRMPARDPHERTAHFDEVELGYDRQQARVEASRCLLCPDPLCVQGCPVHNDIPGFIRAIVDQEFEHGIKVLRRTTNFPAICGRVCDFARQCEGACVLAQEGGDPIAIGALERFLGEWERTTGRRGRQAEQQAPATGRRVAIVGSGPSGLACAADLALRGHQVTVFESLPVIGGALAWGIPTFRLPPAVLAAEIEFLEAIGVHFQVNTTVGQDLSIDELLARGYDAVFIGAGTTVPTRLKIPGEELEGVYTATEFLTRAKLSQTAQLPGDGPPQVGTRLAVIGAGNTAMDVAQTAVRLGSIVQRDGLKEFTSMDVAETALRLGFREVTVVYRRSESEMPARREEVASAREEGVRFMFLTTPVRFIGNEQGRLVAMECQEMGLGPPDASGRRRPVPKPGTEFRLPVDTVVLALGYQADGTLTKTTGGLATDRWGLITVDRETGRTSRDRVWAGGDIVTGADTVVRAMGAGKRAARDIDRFLNTVPHPARGS